MDKPPQNALTELRVLVRKVIGWVLAPIEVVAFAIHFFVGRIAQLYAGYGVIAALLFAAYWIFRFLVGLAPTSTEVTPPPPVPTTLEKRDVQQPLESPLSRREGVGDRMPVRGAEQIS